jgi:tetratricopeptide (TPR) repeat protein
VRPPTAEEEVARWSGALLGPDAAVSRAAEVWLLALDDERRAALARLAARVPGERDARWLVVLDANDLLRDADESVRLDALLAEARHRDRVLATKAAEALVERARADPAPLVARLSGPGPGREAGALALARAGRTEAVPALVALLRGATTEDEARAAAEALATLAPEAPRPRRAASAEEREADAAAVEAWLAGRDADHRAEAGAAEAEALLARGDAAAAADAFRRLAAEPGGAEHVRVQAGLASALLATGSAEAALAPLAVVASRRGDVEDHVRLAEATLAVARDAIERGTSRSGGARTLDVVPRLRDAVDAARAGSAKAGETGPLAARLARVEGEALRLLGDGPGAESALSRPSLEGDVSAQDLLARVRYEAGAFSAAADAWTKAGNARGAAAALAAGKDPRAVPAWAALVRAAPEDEGLAADAIAAAVFVGDVAGLDAALAALPADGAAGTALARTRGRLAETGGKAADAVPFYRTVIADRPDDVAAARDLGRALLQAAPGDAAAVEESMRLLLRVLEREPADRDARRSIEYQARVDATTAWREWPSRARLDRCVALFGALAKADPADGNAWTQHGIALRWAGRATESVAAFDHVVADNPFDAASWNERGLSLLAAGDDAAARASFEKAASVDPGDAAPRQNAARVAWVAGDDDAADAHLGAALKTARSLGRKPMLFRFLADRAWRTRAHPEWR